MKYLKKIVGTR